MTGIWVIKCPRCDNYMKKKDPEELCSCCACGWEEKAGPVYCEHIHNFCGHSNTNYYYNIEVEPMS